MTTMMNYGEVPEHRQSEIIRTLATANRSEPGMEEMIQSFKLYVQQNARLRIV
jgi:hypothetical protein